MSALASADSLSPSLFDLLMTHALTVLDPIIHDFLDTRDLLIWDRAVVHPDERARWLSVLPSVRYRAPFENEIDAFWKHHRNIFQWVVARRMYFVEGKWHMNQKQWEKLVADPQAHELLAHMRELSFDNFSGESMLAGLNLCVRLEHLDVCNLTSVADGPVPVSLPHLRSLRLQNTHLSNKFLALFSGDMPMLTDLEFYHARFEDVDADAAERFMRRFTKLKMIGDVEGLLDKLMTRPTRLTNLYIDGQARTNGRTQLSTRAPYDFTPVLSKVPLVKTLFIDRFCANIPALLKQLTAYTSQLQSLTLCHMPWSDAPVPTPGDRIELLSVTHLLIATPYGEAATPQALRFCIEHMPAVQHLVFSFPRCYTPAPDGSVDALFHMPAAVLPQLKLFEVHERAECLGEIRGARAAWRELADTVYKGREVKLVEWTEWKYEKEKLQPHHMKDSTVVFHTSA